MSLKRPLGLGLLIGLVAMAFTALPTMASAAPQLTDAKGSVAVGTTVTATSTNATTVLPGIGTLKCKHVEVHGIVKTNSGTLVQVEMDGKTDKAKECTLEGIAVEVEPTLSSIELSASTKQAVFEFKAPAFGLTETSTSTVSYTGPATEVHLEGPVGGSANGTFSGDFTISDPFGAITVD